MAIKARAMTSTRAALVVLAGLILLVPAAASGQEVACFRVAGEEPGSVQHLVGLASVVRLSEECEYALSPGGSWTSAGALARRDTDFLELLHHLRGGGAAGGAAPGDPRFIFARPRGATEDAGGRAADLHTLILRYCAHYLLEEQLGFRVVPYGAEEGLRIERTADAADRCDSDRIELRAVAGADGPQLLETEPDPAQTLAVNERALTLPHGEWSIFAARRGGGVALRVGVFRARRVVTPLQHYLRSVGLDPAAPGEAPGPLLAARWRPDESGLLLVPTPEAQARDLLWPELRTAADAGFLWLTRTDLAGTEAPVVLGDATLAAGEPAALRVPDRPVAEHMTRRYGEAGEAMGPTLDDWAEIFSDLALCLTPNYYSGAVARPGTAVPDPGSCAALSSLIALEEGGGGRGAPRVCLHRGRQVMRADEASWEAGGGDPLCLDLPGRGQPMPFRVAVVGDRVSFEGGDNGELCLLVDNRPLEARDGECLLDRSGLLEVRQGGGEGCTSRQALTRLRLPVIDPEREWHPVGLHTRRRGDAACGEDEGSGVCPWRALRRDEPEVFAYVRPRSALEYRLSTSPAVAAAINREPEAPVLMSQDVPVLAGIEGDFEGARPPGIVAYASRDASCPTDRTYEELRRERPLDPDSLVVDQVFHVYLLAVEDPEAPPHCLARSTYRVRHSRDLVNAHAGRWLGFELGLLGDTRLAFYVTEPLALGVVIPVLYLRLALFPVRHHRFLALEIAGNLTVGMSFDEVAVSRAGASLSAALQLGIPRYLPRLLSVGVMLHGAAETHPSDNPIFSVYISLDLSTLVDLAGGR